MKTWHFILEKLRQSEPVILLYVLQSTGSSPGKAGFNMAVTADDMAGSIGGGMMEHKLVEYARKMLEDKEITPVVKQQIHSKTATKNQSGMICSGEQWVVLYPLKSKDLDSIELALKYLTKHSQISILLNQEGLSFDETLYNLEEQGFTYNNQEQWLYKGLLGYQANLHIVGGGHVALAFSKIISQLNFYIQLYEDRADLNTLAQNHYVHQKIITPYEDLGKLILGGEKDYVVLMSFGYRTDKEALKAIIDKDFAYLGMMGSQAKTDQLFKELREEGVEEDRIQKVYSPIGLIPNCRTPEEIAISIAAQIVQIYNIV